ncbi:hypothetical protein H4R33_001829 [Dimargaris cristalligena]|nr:hypothetical protein H4R33_001829 [Dimargaris cristalligena]
MEDTHPPPLPADKSKPNFANAAFQPHVSRRQQKQRLFQKTARQKEGFANDTAFRRIERIYRSRIPPPDLTRVLDFRPGATNAPDLQGRIVPVRLNPAAQSLNHYSIFGEKEEEKGSTASPAGPPESTPLSFGYMLAGFPGLVFIPNPFTPAAQRQLIKDCLRTHAVPPAKSNLDALYDLPAQGLWRLHEQSICEGWAPPPAHHGDAENGNMEDKEGDYRGQIPRKAKTPTVPAPDARYSAESTSSTDTHHQLGPPPPASQLAANGGAPVGQLVPKLRWVTLGYQYNWSNKEYFLDAPQPFPDDIARLAQTVVAAIHNIGYECVPPASSSPEALPDSPAQLSTAGVNGNSQYTQYHTTDSADKGYIHQYSPELFKPEAGVINYYQARDSLMAHVDRSEINMTAPLVSLSLGNTAIFVIGDESRDTEPIALYLRSGDIVCIPRIIENTLPDYLASSETVLAEDPDWSLFGDYMQNARLNVNVRQVF